MEQEKEIALLKEVIKQLNKLLFAYRFGSPSKADQALTALDKLYEQLGYKPY